MSQPKELIRSDQIVKAARAFKLGAEHDSESLDYAAFREKFRSIKASSYSPEFQRMLVEKLSVLPVKLQGIKDKITELLSRNMTPAVAGDLQLRRRIAQSKCIDIEWYLRLASKEILERLDWATWADIVGRIYRPYADMQMFRSNLICVYRDTKVHSAEVWDENLSGTISAILERDFEGEILKYCQNIMRHRGAVGVYRVFFNEEYTKAYLQLNSPTKKEPLEDYARRTIDLLLDRNIIS